LIHLPAYLPDIPGHPGLIEYIDTIVVGVLLMVMLWFRPQGVVPERIRRSPFALTKRSSKTLDDGAVVVPATNTEVTAAIGQETTNG